jgi:hypothetical protein
MPDTNQSAQGIALVDDKKQYMNEGTWGASKYFPTDGEDFVNPPPEFVAHIITDFNFRVPKE